LEEILNIYRSSFIVVEEIIRRGVVYLLLRILVLLSLSLVIAGTFGGRGDKRFMVKMFKLRSN
jgi:hypothetical protein